MKKFLFESAWIDGAVARQVRVDVDDEGRIASVHAMAPAEDGEVERVNGLAVPGFPNVHSHAFQRAMAGWSERRGTSGDDFWTWRESMYHFLLLLEPDDCYAIARQLYGEMLAHGYTAVGEFHYLHHDPRGRPYPERTAMSDAVARAAIDAGIRCRLLPVLYQHGGFGRQPLAPPQKRFYLATDEFLDLLQTLRQRFAPNPSLQIGLALHSLRAVEKSEALAAVDAARRLDPKMPIHIHAAEQQQEVADALATLGARPVRWILDQLPCDELWCLIHCTHLDDRERIDLAHRRSVVGLCPSTEANLGDGIFPSAHFAADGGRWTIGSDSHVSVDPRSELRLLEYAQRWTLRRRAVLVGTAESCGDWLCRSAWEGGAAALGMPIGRIAVGALADLAIIDTRHPSLAGLPPERWLDGFVFCDAGNPVRATLVGGSWRSPAAETASVAETFAAVTRKIAARL